MVQEKKIPGEEQGHPTCLTDFEGTKEIKKQPRGSSDFSWKILSLEISFLRGGS